MKDFEKDYRKWSKIALISIVMFLFTIATIDSFLGFDFSKNMYVMSIVCTGVMMTMISLSWIRILNCKLMKSDFFESNPEPAHASTTAPTPDPQPVESTPLTIDDIEMCIRKEGYVPQKADDVISFKIAGERYEVYYLEEKFTILKKFGISDDIDKDILLKACSLAHDEIFMFRSYTHTYENDMTVLCFEVETYVYSAAELERYFPQYLSVINAGIDRQREIYQQLVEEVNSRKAETTVQTMPEAKVVS